MSRAPGRLRAIFDCNILIQAFAFDGPAASCLKLAETGRIELFVSKAGLSELRRVFTYEGVRVLSPNMTAERIGAFLQRLEFRATLVRRVPRVFAYPRDPKDEPYMDLAAATGADFLVSRDKDLLSLMTGRSPLCKRFRRMTHPLRVVDPIAFLRAADQFLRLTSN